MSLSVWSPFLRNRQQTATNTPTEKDLELGNAVEARVSEPVHNDSELATSEKYSDVISAVKNEILGQPHSGWRQFFYMLDPYKPGKYASTVHASSNT